MSLINFHIPRCCFYLILIAIIRTGTDFIRNIDNHENDFKNPFFRSFIMFFSQIFAIFLLFIQKFYYKNVFIEGNEYSIEKNYIFNFYYIMIWLTLMTFLGNFSFRNLIYNYTMKKINTIFLDNFELLMLFLSYFFIESNLLKIKNHRHHYIAIILCILCFIFIVIYFSFKIDYSFLVVPFICSLLISIESQFFQSVSLTIPKKLNYEYFINMNYILFIQGIFGIILVVVLKILYSFFYNYNLKIFQTLLKNFFPIKLIYMVLICSLNILNLKVIEETRPSYLAIGKGLTNFLIRMSRLIQQYYYPNKYKDLWNVVNVLFDIITLLSFCIFCELITFNFCELDKYTIQKTEDRGESDTINGISEVQEFDFFFHI